MLKNLTPHEVKIFKLNGVMPDLDVVIEASDLVAFDKLGMDKQIKCLCVPIDHSKPCRLIEVFNLMAPDDIKVTNIIHYDNIEDALNEKARIEYETSKYPGTDVNSYFVI